MRNHIKKNDRIKLKISSYAFEGKGIAKIDLPENVAITEVDIENICSTENTRKYVIFVEKSYPGDTVIARIHKIKTNYAEAVAEEILIPSLERIKAKCAYFGVCGGCKQQNLNYKSQINYKQIQTQETFERIGGLSGFSNDGIIEAKETFYYRNKMEYSFSDKRWLSIDEIASGEIFRRNFALGLHVPNVYDKVVDIDLCLLQEEKASEVLRETKSFFDIKGIKGYSGKTHEGFLRNLVIRNSFFNGEYMVNLVTAIKNDDLLIEYTGMLSQKFPFINTVVNNVNTRKAMIATGEFEIVYKGTGYITDKIGDLEYRVSANSFFQTNTVQAANLYLLTKEYACLEGTEIVYDLFCGAGTISLYLAKKAKHVYGFESVQAAINDANYNRDYNEIKNTEFFAIDLYKSFLPFLEANKLPKPDTIIVDPPRAGMHLNTVNDILALRAKKIVYVSCNPGTQARDVKLLVEGGYKHLKMKQVDMFPHTFHIENVALLTLK